MTNSQMDPRPLLGQREFDATAFRTLPVTAAHHPPRRVPLAVLPLDVSNPK
jgi:hypothetical protein